MLAWVGEGEVSATGWVRNGREISYCWHILLSHWNILYVHELYFQKIYIYKKRKFILKVTYCSKELGKKGWTDMGESISQMNLFFFLFFSFYSHFLDSFYTISPMTCFPLQKVPYLPNACI